MLAFRGNRFVQGRVGGRLGSLVGRLRVVCPDLGDRLCRARPRASAAQGNASLSASGMYALIRWCRGVTRSTEARGVRVSGAVLDPFPTGGLELGSERFEVGSHLPGLQRRRAASAQAECRRPPDLLGLGALGHRDEGAGHISTIEGDDAGRPVRAGDRLVAPAAALRGRLQLGSTCEAASQAWQVVTALAFVGSHPRQHPPTGPRPRRSLVRFGQEFVSEAGRTMGGPLLLGLAFGPSARTCRTTPLMPTIDRCQIRGR